jgi:AcrR family transcriptional regulator
MIETAGTPGRGQEILEAAETVFARRGYAQTTMEEVAREAGVSKGSLYNYFRSKKDLFSCLCQAELAEDFQQVEVVVAQGIPASEKLEWLLNEWFLKLDGYLRMGVLVLEFWATAARGAGEGEMASILGGAYDQWRKQLVAIVSQGVEAGEFRRDVDPAVAAGLIMSVIDGTIVQSIVGLTEKVDEAFLAALKRAIMTCLRAPAC